MNIEMHKIEEKLPDEGVKILVRCEAGQWDSEWYDFAIFTNGNFETCTGNEFTKTCLVRDWGSLPEKDFFKKYEKEIS